MALSSEHADARPCHAHKVDAQSGPFWTGKERNSQEGTWQNLLAGMIRHSTAGTRRVCMYICRQAGRQAGNQGKGLGASHDTITRAADNRLGEQVLVCVGVISPRHVKFRGPPGMGVLGPEAFCRVWFW